MAVNTLTPSSDFIVDSLELHAVMNNSNSIIANKRRIPSPPQKYHRYSLYKTNYIKPITRREKNIRREKKRADETTGPYEPGDEQKGDLSEPLVHSYEPGDRRKRFAFPNRRFIPMSPARFELTTTGSLRADPMDRGHIRPALHQAKLRAHKLSSRQIHA